MNNKNDLVSNFKNYLAYIKKRTIQNNETLGKCNICNQDKKLKNNVCYDCYKKQYDKNIDYTKNLNSTTTTTTTTTIATNTNKKKLALIGLGALISVIGVSTYLIIHYTKDNDKSSTLVQLKLKEKEKIQNIKPLEKILPGASLSSITTKNKYENIIDSAIKEIDNSKTKDALNAIVAKHTKLVTNARNSYDNAIKFANKKHLAKTEINKIVVPTLNAATHSAAKHALIATAKESALKAINEVTDIKTVEEVKAAQIEKINNTIKEYEESTGTTKALADGKDAAKPEINKIIIPTLDAAEHSAIKHALIAGAKESALKAINEVTDIKTVEEVKVAQIAKINNVIKEYEESTGTTKALADGKDAAKPEINKIIIPTLDAAEHSAIKHALIAGAKESALKAINEVTDIKTVEEVKAAQIEKINNAIKEYEESTGTTKALADAKDAAKIEINKIIIPTLDAAEHSAIKHALIAGAKESALKTINEVTDIKTVEEVKVAQIAKIKDLINKYNASTGTTKALADAKDAAKIEINKIIIPTLDAAEHSAIKHALIAGAKESALKAINEVTDIKTVEEVKVAQIAKIKDLINKYNASTGTTKALADAKDAAKIEINKIIIPTLDAAEHSAIKHALIAGAKESALKAINEVTDIKTVEEVKVAQIEKINNAIKEYEESTGTTKALADAKDAAKIEINKIIIPTLDAAEHSAIKHALIAGAKESALKAINEVTDIKTVEEVKVAQIAKIKDLINKYNASTGTTKALADAKDAAKIEINKIIIPTLDAAEHSAIKHALIAGAKESALKTINEVTDIKTVEEVKVAQIAKIKDLINKYNASTGTTKALADAKDAAKIEINKIIIPTLDAAEHSAIKHALIAGAKESALKAINEVTDIKTVEEVKVAQIAKIKDLINKYNASTGTTKALADAKDAAKPEINKIIIPTLDAAEHSAIKHALIAGAKESALKAINEVTDIKTVEEVKAAQIEKINNAIKEYEESTGTTKALADAKDAAKTEINKIIIPTLDAAEHSAIKHALIAGAKESALKAINEVTDIKTVEEVKVAQIAKIKDLINKYNASTGTTKALADAKDAAIAVVKAIDLPAQDDKEHDAKLFAKIVEIKKAAIEAINNVTDHTKVAEIKVAQTKLINDAITNYKDSVTTWNNMLDAIKKELDDLSKLPDYLEPKSDDSQKYIDKYNAKSNELKWVVKSTVKKIGGFPKRGSETKIGNKNDRKLVINRFNDIINHIKKDFKRITIFILNDIRF